MLDGPLLGCLRQRIELFIGDNLRWNRKITSEVSIKVALLDPTVDGIGFGTIRRGSFSVAHCVLLSRAGAGGAQRQGSRAAFRLRLRAYLYYPPSTPSYLAPRPSRCGNLCIPFTELRKVPVLKCIDKDQLLLYT